jgi:hypothetical protein
MLLFLMSHVASLLHYPSPLACICRLHQSGAPPLVALLLMVPSIAFFTIKAHNDQVDSAFWFGAPNYNYQTDA